MVRIFGLPPPHPWSPSSRNSNFYHTFLLKFQLLRTPHSLGISKNPPVLGMGMNIFCNHVIWVDWCRCWWFLAITENGTELFSCIQSYSLTIKHAELTLTQGILLKTWSANVRRTCLEKICSLWASVGSLLPSGGSNSNQNVSMQPGSRAGAGVRSHDNSSNARLKRISFKKKTIIAPRFTS